MTSSDTVVVAVAAVPIRLTDPSIRTTDYEGSEPAG